MTSIKNNHEKWMKAAFREAEKAFEQDEVPIGAVVVKNGIIIGRGYNQCESLNDPTAHAEIIAITSAANTIKNWRLKFLIFWKNLLNMDLIKVIPRLMR